MGRMKNNFENTLGTVNVMANYTLFYLVDLTYTFLSPVHNNTGKYAGWVSKPYLPDRLAGPKGYSSMTPFNQIAPSAMVNGRAMRQNIASTAPVASKTRRTYRTQNYCYPTKLLLSVNS